jgi:hypothetical protein
MVFMFGNATLAYNTTSRELHNTPLYINFGMEGAKYKKGYLLLTASGSDLNIIELKSAHQVATTASNFRMPVYANL